MATPVDQDTSQLWLGFFDDAKKCKRCVEVGSNFKVRDAASGKLEAKSFKVLNPLADIAHDAAWGIPWYDRHRNLNADVMLVGMDFGGEETVKALAAMLAADPDVAIGEDLDKTFAKLTAMLFERTDDPQEQIEPRHVYVTNAALCIGEKGCPETGELNSRIYKNCLPNLRAQINLVKPYVIVALGNVALDSICRALDKRPQELGLLGQVTKDAAVEASVQINQATVAIRAFLHPGREQPTWRYQRHQTELYAPLRRLLKSCRQQLAKSEHRGRFGELPPQVSELARPLQGGQVTKLQ